MANYPHNLETLQATDETSPAVGYQAATVCVPVTVTPFANVKPTITYGISEAVVTPGISVLTGTANASGHFTITQNICIAVPVEFGANASVGDPFVTGKAASANAFKGCNTSEA